MKLKNLIALATLASSGFAAVAAPIVLSPDPTTPGTFTGNFTQAVESVFVNEFDFLPMTFSGLISFVLTGVGGNVNFFVADVNGQGFSGSVQHVLVPGAGHRRHALAPDRPRDGV